MKNFGHNIFKFLSKATDLNGWSTKFLENGTFLKKKMSESDVIDQGS